MREIKSIALSGYYLRESGNNETIFGRNVAAKELLVNLIKHTSAKELCFAYVKDSYQYNMIKRLYKKLGKENQLHTELNLMNRIDLLQKNKKIESDIIHDCVEDFYHAAFLREKFSAHHPPISTTIHCASQQELSHSYLIPNLLVGLRSYDTVFCSSNVIKRVLEKQFDHVVQQFQALYGVKLERNFRMDVVPLGIDDDNFSKVDKIKARCELNLSRNSFIILYFGRVSSFFKGDIMPLLRVVKNLIDKNPDKNIKLIISGTENNGMNDYKYIKRYIGKLQIENHIVIYQNFDSEKRNLLFSAADVFTSPTDSVQETFGLTPLEAMACGTVQIVSDWDGYKETVIHGETGFRVPTYWSDCVSDLSEYPEAGVNEYVDDRFYSHFLMGQSVALDLEKYEEYFQKLIDNERLLEKMSQKSIEVFYNRFTMKKTIRAYEEVWKEQIAEKEGQGSCDTKPYLELFNNRYREMFIEFPTSFLSSDEPLIITQLGQELLLNHDLIPWHYAEEKSLNEVDTALQVLSMMTDEKTYLYQELVKLYIGDVTKNTVSRSVMWLLKHGFIKRKIMNKNGAKENE